MLGLSRLQQAVFAQALAMNRAASTGPGSGFLVAQLLSDQDTGAINQNFTGIGIGNAVDVTSSSATIQMARAGRLKIEATALIAVTAGTDFFYVYIDVDGAQSGSSVVSGDGPKGYYSAPLLASPLLSAGNHTIKLRGYVGAAATTGTIVRARTFTYQLGA